jgi:hypothetical protein
MLDAQRFEQLGFRDYFFPHQYVTDGAALFRLEGKGGIDIFR